MVYSNFEFFEFFHLGNQYDIFQKKSKSSNAIFNYIFIFYCWIFLLAIFEYCLYYLYWIY